MLIVKGLCFSLGTCSIGPISCSVGPSDHLFITGPSGIGKTLFLECIAGRWRPTSGDILWNNQSILRLSPSQRGFGLVYQDSLLFTHISVLHNVLLAFPRSEKRPLRAAQELLERFEISHLMHRNPSNLSGGEAQRVALVRALAMQPKLLLLDEPYAALDQDTRRFVEERVSSCARHHDIPIIEVTHDPQRIQRLALEPNAAVISLTDTCEHSYR